MLIRKGDTFITSLRHARGITVGRQYVDGYLQVDENLQKEHAKMEGIEIFTDREPLRLLPVRSRKPCRLDTVRTWARASSNLHKKESFDTNSKPCAVWLAGCGLIGKFPWTLNFFSLQVTGTTIPTIIRSVLSSFTYLTRAASPPNNVSLACAYGTACLHRLGNRVTPPMTILIISTIKGYPVNNILPPSGHWKFGGNNTVVRLRSICSGHKKSSRN